MKNQIPRIVAILTLVILYAFTLPMTLNKAEKAELAKTFKFKTTNFPYPDDLEPKYVHEVHPQYHEINKWVSSVGASVAFADIDNDGLFNDIVHVDPRFDKVFVFPAPNTAARFPPFELRLKTLPFSPENTVPSGILTNDFNEDGKTDVLVFFLGRTPVIFYQGENYQFEEQELSPNKEMWYSTTGTLGDLNGDGHADVLIGNYFPNETKLLHASATDKDQVMQHSMSRGDNGAKNKIFLWAGVENGQAIFKENTEWIEGLQYPFDWTLGIGTIDLNDDLLAEIYVANDFGPDKLLLNTSKNGKLSFKELYGERKFATIRSNVLGKDSFKGMGVEFGDINNDGLFDIYVSNIAADYALHESHFMFVNTGAKDFEETGVAPFVNKSEAYGLSRSSWGWGTRLADFNNDGTPEAIQATGFIKGEIDRWPELQELATLNDELLADPDFWPRLQPGDDLSGDAHLPFFVKHPSGTYFDLAENLGIGENQMTRGLAVSDVDHDGKLDFASANQWEPSKIYRNQSTTDNTFLGLQIEYALDKNTTQILVDSDQPSRPAIGAIARIDQGNNGILVDYVDGGNGHSGRNSKEIHFGLGSLSKEKQVSVALLWKKSNDEVVKSELKLTPGWHKIILPF